MARSIHEQLTVRQPDFIPDDQKHLHPHRGGLFCDYVPEKMTCEDVSPTAEYTAQQEAAEIEVELETLPVEPEKPEKKK